MAPPYHFRSVYAFWRAIPRTPESIQPVFEASLEVTGFPTIIFFGGTPLLIIYWTEVPEKYPPEFTNND